MRAEAYAKVNLDLRLRSRDATGLHPLRSLTQSIDWQDTIAIEAAEDDAFEVEGPDEIRERSTNLAWRAVQAVVSAVGAVQPFAVRLEKRIPVAAGLGGGSADAAASLVLAARLLGATDVVRDALAPDLGADVPFCLAGGSAWVTDHGEQVESLPSFDDFAISVVVPPFPLSTAAVYRRWDDLGGPSGVGVAGRDLPVSLRDHDPLGNDLTAAAVDLEPALGDWMADARSAWGHPALMSGSGPAIFGFFADRSEAAEAAAAIGGARAVRGCRPIAVGWRMEAGGTLPV